MFIYSCSSISFCFIYFDALVLGIYMSRIFMSALRNDACISMQCPSLFLIIFLIFKSAFLKLM